MDRDGGVGFSLGLPVGSTCARLERCREDTVGCPLVVRRWIESIRRHHRVEIGSSDWDPRIEISRRPGLDDPHGGNSARCSHFRDGEQCCHRDNHDSNLDGGGPRDGGRTDRVANRYGLSEQLRVHDASGYSPKHTGLRSETISCKGYAFSGIRPQCPIDRLNTNRGYLDSSSRAIQVI